MNIPVKNLRVLPLFSFGILALPLSGCDCGGEGLLDARARLTVTPDAVDFGNVSLGELRLKSVRLENHGLAVLKISRFELSAPPEFVFASPVPASLQPSETLDFNLVYEPKDLGEDTGTITIVADDREEPRIIPIRGVGVQGGIEVAPAAEQCPGRADSIAFGNVVPGDASERMVRVRSVGSEAVEVLSAVPEPGSSREWSIDGSGLPKTLAPGEELILVATYAPVDGGPDEGAFIVTTNAASTPSVRIPVCGAGVAPALCARPVPLDFGALAAGRTASGKLTLESCGLEPLELRAIVLASDAQHPTDSAFTLTLVPALPVTLSPGQTTDVEVSFRAGTPYGVKSGWVQADSNALNNTRAFFPLTGRVAEPCGLVVAPQQIVFHGVNAGSTDQRSILLANNGEIDCEVSSLTLSNASGGNEFTLVGPPPTPFAVPSGGSQVLSVQYAPQNAGPHMGEVRVEEAAGNVSTVSLVGNPPPEEGCVVEVRPTVVTFGGVAIGMTAMSGVEVHAVGEDPCRVESARLINANPAFAVTLPPLRTAIPMFGPVSIGLAFTPASPGGYFDVLEIVVRPGLGASGGGGTFLVGISAAAAESRICVTPTELDFGAVGQGGSAMQMVSITSCGAADLVLRGIVVAPGTSPMFQIFQTPSLPATLPGGSAAAPPLSVIYSPTSAGPHFGQIDVLSSDPQSPVVPVRLSGNWDGVCTQILECAPINVDFGNTDVGTSKILRVACRNAGTQGVTISSASLTGGSAELSLVTTTPATLSPGQAWTLDVRYEPSAAGSDSATLSILSNACIGPSSIPVAGTGQIVPLPPCQPPSTFQPVVQWEWHGSTVEPAFRNVWQTPLVANLTDDNGDGRVDENDVPEVIFVSFDEVPLSDATASQPGILRVLSGDTGAERFSVTEPRLAEAGQLAAGDIDGDGFPEVIGFKWKPTPPGTGMGNFFGRFTTGTLVAIDRNGRLLWESDPFTWPQEVLWNAAGPALSDLDGDGFAEIIVGREVWDHLGHIVWRGTADAGLVAGGPHSIAADIDLDGRPEVIAGGTVYHGDGSIFWDVPDIREGGSAVGMLDPTDPYPRVAIFSGTAVTVYDHLGNEQWSNYLTSMGAATQLPTIADFNGDGTGDIAVADGEAAYIYSGTGALIWQGVVMDGTCCPGINAFDFEGDGRHELVLNDFGQIYVYRYDGTNLYTAPRLNPTNFEMPVVADIDNDRKAEIVVALYDSLGTTGGVIAYSNIGDTWVAAPRIWNQQSYHVINVTEAGAIPRVMTPIPQGPNVFRGTVARCE